MGFFPGEQLIGSVIGGALSYKGAREANQMSQQIAREQMGFQERMSNTSYQRAVADLEAAGLNPMLAYGQGGASSPAGASSNVQNELAGVSSSAREYSMMNAQIQNMKEQNKLIQAQVEDTKAAAALKEALGFGAKVTAGVSAFTGLGRVVGGLKKLGPLVFGRLKSEANYLKFFNSIFKVGN